MCISVVIRSLSVTKGSSPIICDIDLCGNGLSKWLYLTRYLLLWKSGKLESGTSNCSSLVVMTQLRFIHLFVSGSTSSLRMLRCIRWQNRVLKKRNCLNGPKQFSLLRYISTHGRKLLLKVQNCSNVYSGQHYDQQHPSFNTIYFWIYSDGSVLIIIVLSGLKPVHFTDVLCTSLCDHLWNVFLWIYYFEKERKKKKKIQECIYHIDHVWMFLSCLGWRKKIHFKIMCRYVKFSSLVNLKRMFYFH